jgi:SAM-dependent methyltransferase
MSQGRITQEDLAWWWEFATTRSWTFAKTYAETAPHHYVVEGRTPGVAHEDMVRAARVIHTFGTPGKYYSLTKIYLVSPDGQNRWWTEDKHFTDATLVNRATTERSYGIQNAPTTGSGIATPYDQVATAWDAAHPVTSGEADQVKQLLAGARDKFPPQVLDLGCGTGRVLDLGLATPDRYAAVDASQAMLNVLVRKHPKVAAVYPLDVRKALNDGMFTPGQFDWVFLDDAVELDDRQHSQVAQIARLAVITISADEWVVHDVRDASVQRTLALAAELRAAS